jgi:hypothetical protein
MRLATGAGLLRRDAVRLVAMMVARRILPRFDFDVRRPSASTVTKRTTSVPPFGRADGG